MNASEILQLVLNFISSWAGTTIPRIFIAFLGMLCVILTIVAFWDQRIKVAPGLLLLITGILMVAVALDPRILYFLAETSYLTRIRILMLTLSVVVMATTIEAIRRSHLQERYALLWIGTSIIIFLTAIFPQMVGFLTIIIGTQYLTAVIGIIFTFLLLIAFHFSISLSTYSKKQTNISQQCAILEERIAELNRRIGIGKPEAFPENIRPDELFQMAKSDEKIEKIAHINEKKRSLRGAQIAVPAIIAITFVSALIIGWMTPQPILGDEVTHYYMLIKQAGNLSQPNFYAEIPTAWGEIEYRRYPHAFLWHYIGAVIYRLSGGNFYAVQLYQCLFLAQLLIIAYLLGKSRLGVENRSVILYVIVLASLPISILFSVTFYQDIPLSAQILTAFYFLKKKRHLIASFFMCFAIGIKITAFLFLPAFFIIFFIEEAKMKMWFQGGVRLFISIMIIFSFTWSMRYALKTYAEADFYPETKLYQLIKSLKSAISTEHAGQPKKTAVDEMNEKNNKTDLRKNKPITPYDAEIIANHPGDLRIAKNYLIYGGLVIWIVLLAGLISIIWERLGLKCALEKERNCGWLVGVGGSYILFTAYFLHSAPDARFFLPGLPFLILPLAERVVRLPRPKILIAIISTLAILQAGFVLAKTYKLRNVTPETREAIDYLARTQPNSARIFMYPEGNYRLFPLRHDWYLGYKLREFWHGDNNFRITLLNNYGISLIVVKKHLIAPVSEEIINLGVYPDYFIRDLEKDTRFEKLFENNGIIIYRVPSTSRGL
jgi:hypothetical protein